MRTRVMAVVCGVVLAGGAVAHAASNPKAIAVRLSCALHGVNGTADTTKQGADACNDLQGWFDGYLEWVSGGVVQFKENGPLHAERSAGDDSSIEIYADGNNDPTNFANIYDDPRASILTLPDLSVRVWQKRASKKPYVMVLEQRYTPVASALWAKHCEDSGAAVDLSHVEGEITAERQARLASESAIVNMFVRLVGNDTIRGTKIFLDLIMGTILNSINFTGPLAGDVTGGQTTTFVGGLRGILISARAPMDGDVLTYNAMSNQWEPRIACQGIRLDCNRNPGDGCEANVLSDPANCGGCGVSCGGGANGMGTCQLGVCQLVCMNGFGNCDGNPANGCETIVGGNDAHNCGACNADCGGGQCLNGACIKPCPQGFTQCGGQGQCFDLAFDPLNCGGCGAVCPNGSACMGGVCQQHGMADAGVPPDLSMPPCPNGQVRCGNVCVNIVSDPNNCGNCGLACPPNSQCMGGVCQKRATCFDGLKDGSETDVDCGGGQCPACPVGKGCFAGSDCQTATCANGICQAGCGQGGQFCAVNADCCGGMACTGGACMPCGGPGQTCCPNNVCIGGGTCNNNLCLLGGNPGQPCCMGNACNMNSQCVAGVCR